MSRTLCWILLAQIVAICGCGTLPSRPTESNAWLAKMRRQLLLVGKDIQADLDFHETEGLEDFAPNALQQVKAMRSDINGASGITRERVADNTVVQEPRR